MEGIHICTADELLKESHRDISARFVVPAQIVDATLAWSLLAGV